MTHTVIPAYTYRDQASENSLLQGDILKVEGQFRQYFMKFYPAINHPDGEDRYAMVLTQSCDLVRTQNRKPKLTHINVCLVRSLKWLIQRLIIDEIKPLSIAGENLLQKDTLDQLKDKLSKLLNNSDQKTYFFLPKQLPFVEDMVAILPLSFSFRTDHYDLLLQNRVLWLKSEFQAKVGNIISQLYGRIGTPDLANFGWDDKETRNYINSLLHDLNLVQVPDQSYIDYIKSNFKDQTSSIEMLIRECEALKVDKKFQPIKKEMIQNIRNHMLKLFEDKEKIDKLMQMDKRSLSKEIETTLQAAIKISETSP